MLKYVKFSGVEKKKYSAPELESVRLLDEMPVLCSSGGGGGGTNNGVFVRFKGNNASFSNGYVGFYNFNIQGSIRASGSIMSLVSADAEDDEIPAEHCFVHWLYKSEKGS